MGKLSPVVRSIIPAAGIAQKQPICSSRNPSSSIPKLRTNSGGRKQAQTELQNVPSTVYFRSGCLQEAKRVFPSLLRAAESVNNSVTTTRYFNSVLQSHVSVSDLDNSIAFLSHMIKTAGSLFRPNLSTFHVLLSCSSYNADSSPLISVRKVLNYMVQNGFQPTPVTADLAVRLLASADHLDDAITLVKEMCSKDAQPDIFTYNFLVKCLCKTRLVSTVYEFIDEMQKSCGLNPNLVTYTMIIDNVCNSKNIREALRLITALKNSGFKPDAVVYNTIMKGYCRLSKGGEVLRVYNQMKDEEVEPDLVSYNTLIFGLATSGKVEEATRYFKVMVDSGFRPDAVSYTSLMNGMCRKGDAMGAMSLLEDMKVKGCAPTSCTYNTLLHGLCKARILETGIKLYRCMKEDGMELDSASYAALVRALCKVGRVAEAYEVFDYAMESKSLSSASAYLTLEDSLKWLKRARKQGLGV